MLPSINSAKFKTVENVLYQIQKSALHDYLGGTPLDTRLSSLNLLRMSQLNLDEINLLKRAFTKEKNQFAQVQAVKVLEKCKPKKYSNNYSKLFQTRTNNNAEEQELLQLEENLNMVLKSKLHTCKIFNGTHLVDPTMDELKKLDTMGQKQVPQLRVKSPGKQFISRMKRQQSEAKQKIIFDPKKNEESIKLKMVQSEANMLEVLEKYKKPELDPQVEKFLNCVKNGDAAELQQIFQSYDNRYLVDSVDERGNYAIHIAVINKDIPVLKQLIDNGADKSVRTKKGKSVWDLNAIYLSEEVNALLKGQKDIL